MDMQHVRDTSHFVISTHFTLSFRAEARQRRSREIFPDWSTNAGISMHKEHSRKISPLRAYGAPVEMTKGGL